MGSVPNKNCRQEQKLSVCRASARDAAIFSKYCKYKSGFLRVGPAMSTRVHTPGQFRAPSAPPVLHVHVPGSAGTLLCNMAQQQVSPNLASGRSLNCTSLKNAAGIPHYSLHPELLQKNLPPFWNCSELRTALDSQQHSWVMMDFLNEWNNDHWNSLVAEFMATSRSRCSRGKSSTECCGCTSSSPLPFFPERKKMASSVGMLIVERGVPSPLEDFWSGGASRVPRSPLALAQPPLGAASLCSNLRYTFLMHDPLRRAATLLLERCPYGRRVRHCECLARSLAPLA